ncbi:hypothetical protein Psta_4057 [Pirellula staleyi DSM 6068]|uniref:Zinc-ribbon domain-containing protein n=1 Tax=Pirellula staleyi (strain ATCC 27377 / DSM 6068 / ICPB 4128) TaxID=530564 RepID=D2R2X7_PIRSD|nr:hypothetical protein [Pirellula staleyi]ADB18710.1 hypothetical protein Psta_4057 [Pirellula staleyi DSM 6068]
MADIEWIDAEVVTTAAAPQGVPCEACGTPVEPLDHFCGACGTPNPNFAAAQAKQSRGGSVASRASTSPAERTSEESAVTAEVVLPDEEPEHTHKHFHCDNCGSDLAVEPSQRSLVCPFCDSTYVRELPASLGRERPEFVIGFAITPAQAEAKFKQWLGENTWFRPGDLATKSMVDKLRGMYVPFWSFSTLAESTWQAQIGEYYYRTETYTVRVNGKSETRTKRVRYTEWWPLGGNHHQYYSGYLVSASKGLTQAQAVQIQPYQMQSLKRYEPYFLAGWMSEEYSVDRAAALAFSQQEFYRREEQNVAAHLPGDTHSQLSVQTEFSQTNSDLILLPIYVVSYKYQGQLFQFLLNGQTGKMSGDKPVAWQRVAIVVGVVIAAILLVVLVITFLAR